MLGDMYLLSEGTPKTVNPRYLTIQHVPINFTEITYEEFKEYVLKNKPKEDMEKQDFTIEGSEALKKAFVEESGLKNSSISWSMYLTNSATPNAITSTYGKRDSHFVLPKDWEKALDYVKEYFKEEEKFKVGDWVVVLPEDKYFCNCEQNIAQQIDELQEGELPYVLKFRDGHTNSHAEVRLATPKEIEAVKTKTFKLGEHTAVVTKDKVEIAGRGSLTHQECIALVDKLKRANFQCGGFTISVNYTTINIGCVKKVLYKDMLAIYAHIKGIEPVEEF